jgi:hypothetical protein
MAKDRGKRNGKVTFHEMKVCVTEASGGDFDENLAIARNPMSDGLHHRGDAGFA